MGFSSIRSASSFLFLLSWGTLPLNKAFGIDEFAEFEHFKGIEVTTPMKMKQSVKDTPGTITVITAKQIRDLKIRSIHDIFRLVPGMHVDQSSPFTTVNRGSNEVTPRRLQVLVDGVSEVNPLVGVINWENLPIPIERIAYVEVTRSQSSATYGPNAFFGTINFISKKDDIGTTFTVSGSQQGHSAYIKKGATFGNTTITASLKENKHDEFEELIGGDPYKEDLDVKKANFNLRTNFDNQSLEVNMAVVRGDYRNPINGSPLANEIPDVDIDSDVFSAVYTFTTDNHEIKVDAHYYDKTYDQNWELCAPRFYFLPSLGELYRDNRALVLAALGGQPLPDATSDELIRLNSVNTSIFTDATSMDTVCGNAQVIYRYHTNSLSVSDVWSVNEKVKLSSSLNLAYRWIDSTTYGDGKTSLQKSRVYSNMEFLATDWLTMNAGLMAESLEYDMGNPQLSPRLGFNFHIDENNTVKLLLSQGKRLIDGIEVIDYNQVPIYFDTEIYGSTKQTPFIGYFQLYGNRDHVERIDSYEVVYYANIARTNIELRYWEENLENILNYQDTEDYPITNVKRTGGEFAAQYNHIDNIDIRFTGHYLDSLSDNETVFSDYYAYGGSAYIIKYWDTIKASMGYYGTSKIRFSSYDRVDLSLTKTFNIEGSVLDAYILFSHHRETYQRGIRFGLPDGGVRDKVNEVVFGLELNF